MRDESVWELVDSDPMLNLSSIDWTSKKLIKDNSRKMRRIVNGMRAFEVNSFYEKAKLSRSLSSHFKEKVRY